jgi:hypothetical protein
VQYTSTNVEDIGRLGWNTIWALLRVLGFCASALWNVTTLHTCQGWVLLLKVLAVAVLRTQKSQDNENSPNAFPCFDSPIYLSIYLSIILKRRELVGRCSYPYHYVIGGCTDRVHWAKLEQIIRSSTFDYDRPTESRKFSGVRIFRSPYHTQLLLTVWLELLLKWGDFTAS